MRGDKVLFPERYDDEIAATAYRVSTRMLGGESINRIAYSLFQTGWYSHEVTKILCIAKAIALKGV